MKKIFMDPQEIQELLKGFKNEGYDRIHTSGGTSLEGGHYGGVFVYFYGKESKTISFVGLPYDSDYYKHEKNKEKQHGHTKKPNETPRQTGARELFEETGLKVNPDDLIEIHYNERSDNRPDHKGEMHRQHFYVVNMDKCTGELSSFEGANPIDGETMAPVMVVASEFSKILFGGHKIALAKTMDIIRAISFDYYNAL